MEGTWFPIATKQINNEEFKKLTPTEKIYFWTVLSEYNLAGEQFYKPDIWFAAYLGLSLEKIRKARAKISKLGFIDMVPGMQDKRGRNLATIYKGVKWSEMKEGDQFFKMDRSTFYRLIDYIRRNKLKHADLVAFVYINYFIKTKYESSVSVLKSEFNEISNLPQAKKHITALLKNFKFSSGESLFDYEEQYRAMWFDNICEVVFDKKHLEKREAEIEQKIHELRAKSSKITEEDLVPLFRRLYIARYEHESPEFISPTKEKSLTRLGEPVDLAIAMERYFKNETPLTIKTHTLSWFINNARKFMSK